MFEQIIIYINLHRLLAPEIFSTFRFCHSTVSSLISPSTHISCYLASSYHFLHTFLRDNLDRGRERGGWHGGRPTEGSGLQRRRRSSSFSSVT
ncbi:hypothetical protein HanPI659440_Chr16g0650861 [Helianthus annuus]|nr:hypothetical protein HanPI659440_Chr16g0650861 [Helianthus annuus]